MGDVQPHDPMMQKAHDLLKDTFGFASFRLEQEAVRVAFLSQPSLAHY